MLEKFELIRKIGLFEDYSSSQEGDFCEITLIYGENGVGKSTLAAILDSLREKNANELIKRRTLSADVPSTVIVSLDGKKYKFDGIDWDDQPPDNILDVFYFGFINRNVHASSSVDSEQKRNLCEFVLGRTAVRKLKRLTDADNENRAALKALNAVDKEIERLIKKPDTIETFLGLPNDPRIDEAIERTRQDLKQAQSKEAILKRPTPQAILIPTVDRDFIAQLLGKSTKGIEAGAAAIVKKHISEHLDSDGERWLGYGANHLRDQNLCPFCAQDVTTSALVKAIQSYFSAEYGSYMETLLSEIKKIKEELGLAKFQTIRAQINAQFVIAVQWANVMQINQAEIETSLTEAEAHWKNGEEKLMAIIDSKQSKPLDQFNSSGMSEGLVQYENAIKKICEVNEIILTVGKKAEEYKAALTKADSMKIEQHLSRLENQKMRYLPQIQELLSNRIIQTETRQRLEEEKTVLKKEIDEHGTRVIDNYQAGINDYLRYFGCDMQIESAEPQFPSGKASVQYKLKVHGHEIELGLSEMSPCFETVLSDGDKCTFALSFFFARLKEIDLTGRIIVLDDPVNSLGDVRRTLIEGVIRDLRRRGAQVIVLTHDKRLAAMIWRDREPKMKPLASLQVEKTNQGSRLISWDVERATQSQYVEDYLILSDFLERGGDHMKAAGRIRPYLEQRLRYLFPGPPFSTGDPLGIMLGKIRRSAQGSRIYVLQDKLTELEEINNASLPDHHASDDVPHMVPLTSDGVRIFAEKALRVLG